MDQTKLKSLIRNHTYNSQYIFPFFIQVHRLLSLVEIPEKEQKTKIRIKSETKTLLTWLNNVQKMDKSNAYPILLNIQEYFPYSFWIDVMNLFTLDLKRIIDKSPPVTDNI